MSDLMCANNCTMSRRATLSSTLLCVLLLVLGSRQAGAQSKTSTVLPALLTALADGPIQIRCIVAPKGAVPAQAAAQAARQAVGIPFDAAQASPVAFIDHENLSRPRSNLPCWLVPSSQPFTLPLVDEFAPSGTPRRGIVYAVINARTGVLLEVFNKPRAAWWRRVRQVNEPFLRYLNYQDQTAFPAAAPPDIPLAGPFPLDGSTPRLDVAAYFHGLTRADQFIARYFVYTDLSSQKAVQTPHGTQYQYVFLHQPVWYVCLEGLDTPIGGPVRRHAMPMPQHEPGTVPMPRSEEEYTVINSTTGESFAWGYWRDGKQVDML